MGDNEAHHDVCPFLAVSRQQQGIPESWLLESLSRPRSARSRGKKNTRSKGLLDPPAETPPENERPQDDRCGDEEEEEEGG